MLRNKHYNDLIISQVENALHLDRIDSRPEVAYKFKPAYLLILYHDQQSKICYDSNLKAEMGDPLLFCCLPFFFPINKGRPYLHSVYVQIWASVQIVYVQIWA